MEAFIDFSEGELIEDGVLNQGASPYHCEKNTLRHIFPVQIGKLPVCITESGSQPLYGNIIGVQVPKCQFPLGDK